MRGDSQDHSTSAECFSWEQKPVEDTTKAGSGGTVTGLADYTYNGRDSLFASLTEESPEDIITSLEVGLDISSTQSKYLYGFVWSIKYIMTAYSIIARTLATLASSNFCFPHVYCIA